MRSKVSPAQGYTGRSTRQTLEAPGSSVAEHGGLGQSPEPGKDVNGLQPQILSAV